MSELKKFVWAEHYRPHTIDECIIPENLKKFVKEAISADDLPHLLLTGPAGTGKTALAKVIVEELGAEMLFINASLNRSIDDVKTKVVQFASSVSFSGGRKIIVLDEADGFTTAAQDSLRGVYEEFREVRFFLTCNNKGKIIDAIHSRSTEINFRHSPQDKKDLMMRFFKRVCSILDERGIEYEKKVIAELIQIYFPDFRRTLNELQRYSSSGKIDTGILASSSKENFKALFSAIKAKDFKECRKWVAQNSDVDPAWIFKDLYENGMEYFEGKSFAQAILIIADYQHRAAFVKDLEINTMAAIIELMANCEFK